MSSKTKLTPKLRFPAFRGAPVWEPKSLSLALKFQAGFPFPSSGFNDGGNGLRLIRNRDLRSDDIVIFYSGEIDPNFVVRNGDVLVGMDGDFTPTVWQKGEALLNQRVGRIIPQGKNDHRFLLHLLTLSLKCIEEATARTTVKHLSHSAVENKHEPLPSPAEQQKIAGCLGSVDELIGAQARKLDALKTHKNGLMQQLFPREGETQPRLRFPEFRKAGEWEQKPLGELCRIRTGKKDANEGAVDGVYPFFTCAEKHIYSHSYSFDAEAILIAGNANVGQTSYYNGKFEAYQRTYVLTDFKGMFVPYLYSVLSANLRPDLLAQVQTSAMSYIRLPMLEEYHINAPSSQAEQQRIASCLSSLDALITAAMQKLEALKTHKRGLMQQLFPSPVATGATRVSPLRPEAVEA